MYVLDPMADDLVAERCSTAAATRTTTTFLQWVEGGGGGVTDVTPSGRARVRSSSPRARGCARGFLVPPRPRRGHRGSSLRSESSRPRPTGNRQDAHAGLGDPRPSVRGCASRPNVSRARHRDDAHRSRGRSPLACDKLGQLDQDPATADDRRGPVRSSSLQGAVERLRRVPDGVEAIGGTICWSASSTISLSSQRCRRASIGCSRACASRSTGREKHFDLLVIDEASQLSLPAAVLAGAPLREDGQAIVVGDHRQMPPILAHDWKHEPRRGAQDTRIYASTFESLRDRGFPLDRARPVVPAAPRCTRDVPREPRLREDEVGFHSQRDDLLAACAGSRVMLPLRSPPTTRSWSSSTPSTIAEAQRHRDRDPRADHRGGTRPTWARRGGRARGRRPHRAQRAALKALFPDLAEAGAIDTVERFQGGERDLIIVSATASDPEFVLAEARFLLNPNRLNVAFSRPRKKLIVIGSTTIFRLVPPDMEVFESALLWKRLRYEFSAEVLWEGEIAGAAVRVSGRRVEDESRRGIMSEPALDTTSGRRRWVAGVDGTKGGWLAVVLDGGKSHRGSPTRGLRLGLRRTRWSRGHRDRHPDRVWAARRGQAGTGEGRRQLRIRDPRGGNLRSAVWAGPRDLGAGVCARSSHRPRDKTRSGGCSIP